MSTNYDIMSKTALVTGANRGIGKAIAESFLDNGAAKVYAAVRTLDSALPLTQEYGDSIVPIRIDLDEPETIAVAAETAKDVQAMVNNAGVLRVSTPVADDAIESLDFEMKTNIFGLIRMAHRIASLRTCPSAWAR